MDIGMTSPIQPAASSYLSSPVSAPVMTAVPAAASQSTSSNTVNQVQPAVPSPVSRQAPPVFLRVVYPAQHETVRDDAADTGNSSHPVSPRSDPSLAPYYSFFPELSEMANEPERHIDLDQPTTIEAQPVAAPAAPVPSVASQPSQQEDQGTVFDGRKEREFITPDDLMLLGDDLGRLIEKRLEAQVGPDKSIVQEWHGQSSGCFNDKFDASVQDISNPVMTAEAKNILIPWLDECLPMMRKYLACSQGRVPEVLNEIRLACLEYAWNENFIKLDGVKRFNV